MPHPLGDGARRTRSCALLPPPRLQLRRARAVAHGAVHRDVGQFRPLLDAAEHQPAAAHVAAADEIGGETESLSEMFEENVDVFRGRDAAEENDFEIGRQLFCELFYIAFKWSAITRIAFVDVNGGKFLQVSEPDRRYRGDQSTRGGDN